MHMSAGQRQRLALARSLLAETPLLFLDEPTNKLDLEGVRSVRQMIAELNQRHGVTVILTTHIMEEAEELCDEVALLREGELVTHQSVAALTQSLHVIRPITVTLQSQQGKAAARITPSFPAATAVQISDVSTSSLSLKIESLEIRATLPALLTWVREQGFTLLTMHAEPVTLTDVFQALAGQRVQEKEERK
jgi:ABC-2 type transport system ATP-binding protein